MAEADTSASHLDAMSVYTTDFIAAGDDHHDDRYAFAPHPKEPVHALQ